ncbi:MAG: flavodoxin domain-containing protein [Polyangiales bacterium]
MQPLREDRPTERSGSGSLAPTAVGRRVAVLYATREGHTGRIAEHVAAELRWKGLLADVRHIEDAGTPVDFSAYDGLVLAGSVHLGKHERELVKFVERHRQELEQRPTAFLSVSMSEAGVEQLGRPEDQRAKAHADVQRMIDEFFEQTGWHPARVKPVAGAVLYTKYNALIRFVMKRISKAEGGDTDTSRDYEYTDWVALDRFVDELADEIRTRPAATSPT